MATIELENLTKYFGNQLAVEDVSLQISDGEFLVSSDRDNMAEWLRRQT